MDPSATEFSGSNSGTDFRFATPLPLRCRDGLIAVNYAARAKGVTRHMRVGEAKKVCPELQLVHVRTIGECGCKGRGWIEVGVGLRRLKCWRGQEDVLRAAAGACAHCR